MKKKVLIISQKSFDVTTELVMDWITFYGHKAIRFNGELLEDNDNSIVITNNKTESVFNFNKKLLESNIDRIWYRRWTYENHLVNTFISTIKDYKNNGKFFLDLYNNVCSDYNTLQKLFLDSRKYLFAITSPNQTNTNKIINLNIASKIGLNIPKYIITNRKAELKIFFDKQKRIVVKDLNANFYYSENNKMYMNFVSEISKNDFKKLPQKFGISFFQEYILKKFEIRVFYLQGKFYSMAIFSQNNIKTQTDFRNYDHLNPNRVVPYNLPLEICSKLLRLMKILKLETGSIDLIKDDQNRYFFLEVNPVGQFGMISYPCNYQLESIIARKLINYKKRIILN